MLNRGENNSSLLGLLGAAFGLIFGVLFEILRRLLLTRLNEVSWMSSSYLWVIYLLLIDGSSEAGTTGENNFQPIFLSCCPVLIISFIRRAGLIYLISEPGAIPKNPVHYPITRSKK